MGFKVFQHKGEWHNQIWCDTILDYEDEKRIDNVECSQTSLVEDAENCGWHKDQLTGRWLCPNCVKKEME